MRGRIARGMSRGRGKVGDFFFLGGDIGVNTEGVF